MTEENAQQVSEETASQQVSEETSQQPSVVTSHRPHTEGHHQTANYHTRQTSVSSTDSQWSIGLNASGGLLAASSSQRSIGQSDYPVSGEFNYNNFVDKVSSWPSTSSEVYDYEAKHRLPMSLGLSVYYQLNPRLAFQTGVNYTYLYSEFSTPLYPNIYREQKLHYLGVPVGLSWQFWKTRVSAFISQVLSCFRSVSTKSPGSGLLMPLQVRSMPLRLCWVFILNLRWAITFTMAPLSSIIIKNIP